MESQDDQDAMPKDEVFIEVRERLFKVCLAYCSAWPGIDERVENQGK